MFFGLFKRKTTLVKVKAKVTKPKKAKPKKPVTKPKTTHLKKSKLIKKTASAKVKKRSTPTQKDKSKAASRPRKAVQVIGKVTHYFTHVKAAVILLNKGKISLGDTLHFKGHTTDFKQKVSSMQINNVGIKEGVPGQEIGLLVKSRVRENDEVSKL